MTLDLSHHQGISRLSEMLGCKAVVGKFLIQVQKIHPLWSSYEICLTKYWKKANYAQSSSPVWANIL